MSDLQWYSCDVWCYSCVIFSDIHVWCVVILVVMCCDTHCDISWYSLLFAVIFICDMWWYSVCDLFLVGVGWGRRGVGVVYVLMIMIYDVVILSGIWSDIWAIQCDAWWYSVIYFSVFLRGRGALIVIWHSRCNTFSPVCMCVCVCVCVCVVVVDGHIIDSDSKWNFEWYMDHEEWCVVISAWRCDIHRHVLNAVIFCGQCDILIVMFGNN